MIRARRLIIVPAALLFLLGARDAWAQHTVVVTVPTGVSFTVRDVSVATAGTPATTQVTFSNPKNFAKTEQLKLSVQADTSTFAGPGTTRIPASKVSWTASTSSGTASNGTLVAGSYAQVYVSPTNLKSSSTGSATLSWSLAPVAAAGLRSGTHTLTVRWKFEAF
jgi:hypothetical protein